MSTKGLEKSRDDYYLCIFSAARLFEMGVGNLLNMKDNNNKKKNSIPYLLIINTY